MKNEVILRMDQIFKINSERYKTEFLCQNPGTEKLFIIVNAK